MRVLGALAVRQPYRLGVSKQPYRAPREWLRDGAHDDFGVREHPRWDDAGAATPQEKAELAAAKDLHEFCRSAEQFRTGRGLSWAHLEAHTGLKRRTLQDMFKGKRLPEIPELFAIAQAAELEARLVLRQPKPRPTE
jgi:hypothetical protein